MIYLITGDINTGKTTKMQELFKQNPQGDGIVCPKVFDNGRFIRYDILHLQSGKTMPFAYPADAIPENWDEQICYGKYTFSVQAFTFAETITGQSIKDHISPFFLDEIGPVELDLHEGFYSILKKILSQDMEFYISIRKSRMNDLMDYLDMEKMHTIYL
jgi:nucleoside-triphosphatase THEP1